MSRPSVLIFDVNETLSDLAPMGRHFEVVGAPASLAKVWFAGVLRDGFAMAVAATSEPFARIAAENLRRELSRLSLSCDVEAAAEHIMKGFQELQVHPDVPAGIRALGDLGLRIVTLSNGSVSVAEGLLERARIEDRFERLLSVDDAGVWKPAAAAYEFGLDACGIAPAEAMLVAVHPWDIDGASRAGLSTAWVNRTSDPYPGYFRAPDIAVRSIEALAEQLR